MKWLKGFFLWLLSFFGFFRRDNDGSSEPVAPEPVALPKTIVTLLIFPRLTEDVQLDEVTEAGSDKYYVASPWEMDSGKVDQAIGVTEDWLADVLGTRIGWNGVRTINSQRTLTE